MKQASEQATLLSEEVRSIESVRCDSGLAAGTVEETREELGLKHLVVDGGRSIGW